MNIDVIISADCINSSDIAGKNAVVIDVLRATSVMVTALRNGTKYIAPFATPKEVLAFANNEQGVIMAGERNAVKIAGFHLGNSPLEIDASVKGKILAMTTTNGTKALLKSNLANKVYVGSFLNAKAVAEMLVNDDKDATLVCAGTNGKFSLDDALCAAVIIKYIRSVATVNLSDIAQAHLKMYDDSRNLHEQLQECKHYNILKDSGFMKDLKYCLRLNSESIVPVWNGKEIRI